MATTVKPVIVKIPANIADKWDEKNPLHGNIHVADVLLSHRIPITGKGLGIRGVSRGSLKIERVVEDGRPMDVYTWTPPDDEDEL